MLKTTGKACAVSLFLLLAGAAVMRAQQQPPKFDGTWQMDAAKSHVNDGRVVTITIATQEEGITISLKTHKRDGQESTAEFTSKLNGKACEVSEAGHTSKLTVWFDGPVLNACKENGPPEDVTSIWKLELSPDKKMMTMKISHYEPVADDETIVFNKK